MLLLFAEKYISEADSVLAYEDAKAAHADEAAQRWAGTLAAFPHTAQSWARLVC